MQGRVGHVAALENLALVPSEAIIVGHANRSISAGTRRICVREEQDASARRPLRRIRVCANDRSIVARISQVPVVAERTPGLAAIVGNRLEALACGALRTRVEQQAPVGELDDLVLIRATFAGSARLPCFTVVIGVDRNSHERGAASICDRVLLNQSTSVCAVAQLDALTRRSEASKPLVFITLRHLIGNGARIHPGLTVVVRLNNVCVEDVARIGISPQLRLEKSRVKRLHREEEDRPGGAIDDERRIRETDLIRAGGSGKSGLDRGPRLTAVLRDAVDDRVRLGRILAGFGTAVPCCDDPAVGGCGQGGDAMALEFIQPGRGQARDLTDRVVLGGFHRVRLSCTRTGEHGDGLGSGGNSAGDDVVSVTVTGRRPRRGGGEGTGGQVRLGDRVGRRLALLGRVRGEVVPAAVRRAGCQDSREV